MFQIKRNTQNYSEYYTSEISKVYSSIPYTMICLNFLIEKFSNVIRIRPKFKCNQSEALYLVVKEKNKKKKKKRKKHSPKFNTNVIIFPKL